MTMIQKWNLNHPEIERKYFNSLANPTEFEYRIKAPPPYTEFEPEDPQTSLDIFEVGDTSLLQGGSGWLFKENLDHAALLPHFHAAAESGERPDPLLRILFLHSLVRDSGPRSFTNRIALSQVTAQWLIKECKVSPVFISNIVSGHLGKVGQAIFKRWDKKGNVCAISGFYRQCIGYTDAGTAVWFSHNLTLKTSFYVIFNIYPTTQQFILQHAFRADLEPILRPLAVDAWIADCCFSAYGMERHTPPTLTSYEEMAFASFQLGAPEAVKELHALSRKILILREDLVDFIEWLEFLLQLHDVLVSNTQGYMPPSFSVVDSMQYMLSEATLWKRWVQSYADRTGILINLLFNLTTQKDNRTNLDIAHFTSKIATETQKDSSSMITMAAVTMLFLPGTFVSAIFSMVFFDTTVDENGRRSLSVSSRWWYFPLITIPLTVLVFLVWNIWRRRRNERQSRDLPLKVTPEAHEAEVPSTTLLIRNRIAQWIDKQSAFLNRDAGLESDEASVKKTA